MSHTYIAEQETRFIFNSDMSGPVIIRYGDAEIEIPGEDLMEFLAERLRFAKVVALENASRDDLLQGKV